MAALLVVGGAAGAAWLWLLPARRASHAPSRPTRIAVLPFQNLGPPGDQYFADGVTDELTTRLSAVRQLGVISRTSANQYRHTTKPLKQVGAELGVEYVLEGSVRWARTAGGKDEIRITPQLIRTSDDTHVWAGSYDRELSEIFWIQSDIARKVADALSVTLGTRQQVVLAARPTENMKAYDYFLQASAQEGYGDAQLRRAIELYREAIRADPRFVNAYLGLALQSAQRFSLRYDRSRTPCDTADAALRRAEALAPDDPLVHRRRGFYHYACARDYDRALAEYDAAERLGMPRGALAGARAMVARRQGRFAEAAALYEEVFYFDPRATGAAYEVGNSYAVAGRFADARLWYERAAAVDSSWSCGDCAASMTLMLTGRVDSARAAMRRTRWTAKPGGTGSWIWEMYLDELDRDYESALRAIPRGDTIYAVAMKIPAALLQAQLHTLMNRREAARRSFEQARTILERHRRAAPGDSRVHAALAQAYAGLGRRNEALAAAARAVELVPMSRDMLDGAPAVYWQARTLVLLGDKDAALDRLEQLTAYPFYPNQPFGTTPVQLRLEPWWDPLRAEPRFQKLVQGR